MKVLSENEDMLVHPFDRHYKALNCGLVPIDPTDEIFEVCLLLVSVKGPSCCSFF